MALPVSSNNTFSCADSAYAICSAPDTASTLAQQLDGIKSQLTDKFAEPCGLPPDTGIKHVIPLQLQKQFVEHSDNPYGAHFSLY